jgi:hypothetical protein
MAPGMHHVLVADRGTALTSLVRSSCHEATAMHTRTPEDPGPCTVCEWMPREQILGLRSDILRIFGPDCHKLRGRVRRCENGYRGWIATGPMYETDITRGHCGPSMVILSGWPPFPCGVTETRSLAHPEYIFLPPWRYRSCVLL